MANSSELSNKASPKKNHHVSNSSFHTCTWNVALSQHSSSSSSPLCQHDWVSAHSSHAGPGSFVPATCAVNTRDLQCHTPEQLSPERTTEAFSQCLLHSSAPHWALTAIWNERKATKASFVGALRLISFSEIPPMKHQILFSFPTATALEHSGLISAAHLSHLGRWSVEGGSTEVKTYQSVSKAPP